MHQSQPAREWWTVGGIFLAVLGFLTLAVSAGPAVSTGKISGLTVPLYRKGEPSPAVVLRVGRVFKDYRRVGFYRVRLLQVVVCEDAQLEVLRPFPTADVLADLEVNLRRLSPEQMLEFRNFKVSFPGDAQPRLEARWATFAGREIESGLRLEKVTWRDGGTTGQWANATLRLRTEPGRLTVKNGHKEMDLALFNGGSPIIQPKPKPEGGSQ